MAEKNLSINATNKQEDGLRLISAVQSRPCLWMERDKSFKNIILKNDHWKEVSVEMGEPVESIKKRWRNLTIQYHNNRKLYRASMVTGSDASDVKRPSWWGYQAMSFLEQVNQARRTVSTLQEDAVEEDVEELVVDLIPQEFTTSQHNPPEQVGQKRSLEATEEPGPSSRVQPERKRTRNIDVRVADALAALDESLANVTTLMKDRSGYENVGNFIAKTLAENNTRRNAELCGKIFQLCTEYARSDRSDFIAKCSSYMETCTENNYVELKDYIENFMKDRMEE